MNKFFQRAFFLEALLVCFFVSILSGCGGDNKPVDTPSVESKKYTRFRGSYKSFNDMPDLHLSAARRIGIKPMQSRQDTLKHMDKMVKLPQELDMYKMDELKYSVPFLVEDASRLLFKIGLNFKDSLRQKKLPEYKIVVTSVTRTLDDVALLTKRNSNASDNSVHCYGTTFDISWRRFSKVAPESFDDVGEDRLKLVLGEVLHDLREREQCYIVYERKQACFHITAR